MNFKQNESKQKLNGSYYTPKWLSDFIAKWISDFNCVSILEPSCGDGIFFKSLSQFTKKKLRIKAFDIDTNAINMCKKIKDESNCILDLNHRDFIDWSINNLKSDEMELFNAAVGNPPFVRYQYMDKEIQEKSQELFDLLGIKFSKHTNIWIPFILASVKFLTPGGRLGMIIPAEILHVLYAKGIREYLLDQCHKIMLIDPMDIWFEGTLQGAMILLAEKKNNNEFLGICIHQFEGTAFAKFDPSDLFNNSNYVNGNFLKNKWTYALLTSQEREIYSKLSHSEYFKPFTDLAKVDVGIVTGANKFFLVDDNIVEDYRLQQVAHPMFGRSEHCPGIIYDENQHLQNKAKGYPSNFLYFQNDSDSETYHKYLNIGLEEKYHTRYKCRVRSPWYKVPSVYSTPISMLKRSNGMPRLIFNELNAYTTDTAYRITPKENIDPYALVRCFLNSITALSAELEGRHYGGGVLELVPSEIEKLIVPYTENNFIDLHCLNEFVKQNKIYDILLMQDDLLFNVIPVERNEIEILQKALLRLMSRRQKKPM